MPAYDKAADYRRQAQETRAVARCLSLQDERQRLLDDATRLDTQAEIEERKGQPDGNFALDCHPCEDALLKRAEDAIAEASKLRESHRQILMRTVQQVERMRQIERALNPLFPHPLGA